MGVRVILQSYLAIACSPGSFPDDATKLSYVLSLLQRKALAWVGAFSSLMLLSLTLKTRLKDFLVKFRKTFGHLLSEGRSAKILLNLRQGNRSIAEYMIEFHTVVAEMGWPENVLHGVFFSLAR